MFTKKWFIDTAERVVATFGEAALGLYILAGPANLFTLDFAKGAAAAGVIAAAAVVKAALASAVGNKESASLVPAVPAPDVK